MSNDNSNQKSSVPSSSGDDEILVKGTDGKWYILRGEELVPYESELGVRSYELGVRELPKGVTHEAHERLESKEPKRVPISRNFLPSALSSKPISHEGHPLVKELEELIDQAVAESQKVIQVQIPLWDAVLQKRFRVIVSARLRDVRDNLETKALLTRDIKIGGLGLKEAESQTLLASIEIKFKEFDQKWRAEEAKKRADWQKKQAAETAQREKECAQKEQEELEKRHQMLVGESGIPAPEPQYYSEAEYGAGRSQESVASKVTQPLAPKVVTKFEKPVVAQKATTIAVPGFRRESRSPAPHNAGQVGTSLPPLSSVTRPKVIDVKFTPRLLSPIEELREMNLIDFRRLGRDASEIIFKIKAKIDLLGDESFAKRMEGVAAWKQSEPARLYTALSTIALTSGQSVSTIIAERGKKGEKTLTFDEFRGIMELMKSLRF